MKNYRQQFFKYKGRQKQKIKLNEETKSVYVDFIHQRIDQISLISINNKKPMRNTGYKAKFEFTCKKKKN